MLFLRGFGLYAVGCCWPDPLRSLVLYVLVIPIQGSQGHTTGLYAVGFCFE